MFPYFQRFPQKKSKFWFNPFEFGLNSMHKIFNSTIYKSYTNSSPISPIDPITVETFRNCKE